MKFEPQANVKVGKLSYPKSELVTLLDEKLPVFQKPFRLMQEVTVAWLAQVWRDGAGEGATSNGRRATTRCVTRRSQPM